VGENKLKRKQKRHQEGKKERKKEAKACDRKIIKGISERMKREIKL
jgi:hypothetical protein